MTQQLRLPLSARISHARADFVIGASNRSAIAAIDAWPTWHGGCLALFGASGVGKTHLAQIWAAKAEAQCLDRSKPCIPAHAGKPVLIEDIDQGFSGVALFNLINEAPQRGGGLLLTSRTPPIAWPTGLPDLRSRLNAMPVVEIAAPDDDVLSGLLTKLLKEHNILPPSDLIPYLLARMERSAQAARLLVEQLDDLADRLQRPITRSLARQLFEAETENLDLFAP